MPQLARTGLRGGSSPPQWGDVIVASRGDVIVVQQATPQFVARGPRIQHPRDLQRRNCVPVVSLSNNKVWPWVFRKGGETVTVMPTGSIEVSSVGAGLDFALAGHGIALISDALYQQVPTGTLRVLLPKWHLPNAPVWAVYPSKSHLSPKVRLFVEHLSTALRLAQPR